MGTLYYKDGNLYVGLWKISEKDGYGKMYYKHGEKYFGDFKSGKKSGSGVLISKDGSKFTGTFQDNKKHGSGSITYNNGKKANELWENGILISSSYVTTNSPKRDLLTGNLEVEEMYVDLSFENFLEEQVKNADPSKQNYKQFTLEVAKYFKSKIPNNYFDASHLFLLTNDIIFENPSIIDWSVTIVCKWITRIGLEKYNKSFQRSNIDGNAFLLLSIPELQNTLEIKSIKDIKLIFKSIDFLRIYLKLKLANQEYIEVEKKNEYLLFLKREDQEVNTIKNSERNPVLLKKKTLDDITITERDRDRTTERTEKTDINATIDVKMKTSMTRDRDREEIFNLGINKLNDENLIMEHNTEFFTTKISMSNKH